MRKVRSILLAALVVCLCGLPVSAGSLFSDLGSPVSYNQYASYLIAGSANGLLPGVSFITADMFTVAGSGGQAVSQIDLAVLHDSGPSTFWAAIYTDVSGAPGVQVSHAEWSLSTSLQSDTCCGLVTISGITGVTLSGGQPYFMVEGPLSLSDASWNELSSISYTAFGTRAFSTDGGVSWTTISTLPGAFDVLGGPAVPEPGAVLLIGTGLLSFLAARLRRR